MSESLIAAITRSVVNLSRGITDLDTLTKVSPIDQDTVLFLYPQVAHILKEMHEAMHDNPQDFKIGFSLALKIVKIKQNITPEKYLQKLEDSMKKSISRIKKKNPTITEMCDNYFLRVRLKRRGQSAIKVLETPQYKATSWINAKDIAADQLDLISKTLKSLAKDIYVDSYTVKKTC